MADSPLIETARQWVIDKYPYNSHHLIKALEWLDRIAPDASEAMRLATLTHDMERAFPGPDQPILEKIDGGRIEAAYNVLHSERSARFVGEWLREQGADQAFVEEVEKLIKVHEVGGWPEANLVQAADSLSFLETNIELFLNMARTGKRTLNEVMIKFYTTLHRIQVDHARELALPMYEAAKERLERFLRSHEIHVQAPDGYAVLLLCQSPFHLIHNLTFDVRSNLAVIRECAHLFLERAAPGELTDDEFHKFLDAMQKAVDRSSEQLLTASEVAFLQWNHEFRQEEQAQ
jgi:hypothetical protein